MESVAQKQPKPTGDEGRLLTVGILGWRFR
jgi:hypothetical protein